MLTKEKRVRMIYFQTADGNIYATDSRFIFKGPPVTKDELKRRFLLGTFENMMMDEGISYENGRTLPGSMKTTLLSDDKPYELNVMTILNKDVMKLNNHIFKLSKRNDKLAGLLANLHPLIVTEKDQRYNILTMQTDPLVSYPTEPGELLLLARHEENEEGNKVFRHTQSEVVAVFSHKISRSREVITSSHSGANKKELQRSAFLKNSVHTYLNDGVDKTTVTFADILKDSTKSAVGIISEDPKNPDYVYLEGDSLSFNTEDLGTKPVLIPFNVSTDMIDEIQSYRGVNTVFGHETNIFDEKWLPLGEESKFNEKNLMTTYLRLLKKDDGSFEIQRKIDIRDRGVYIQFSPIVQNSLHSVKWEELSVGQLVGLLIIYPNGRSIVRVGDIIILKKGVK